MSEFMEYALRALSRRALTEHELRTRMTRRGAPEAEVERVLERLREMGYLNDEAVAHATATKTGVGALRVRQSLKQRGVERDVIDSALAARDEDQDREAIRALVERHRDRWLRAPNPRAKAFGFLSRRGYLSGQIHEALRDLTQRDDDGPDDVADDAPEDT